MAYFDNNATTKLHPHSLAAQVEAMGEDWANPSSPYRSAARVRAKLKMAREEWGEVLGLDPEFLTFTSGATEANNAILANLAKKSPPDSRILISSLEHPSISEPAYHWFPDRVDEILVDSTGLVSISSLMQFLESPCPPLLVCMMAASNESGILQPWSEAAKICSEREISFHCDATQWLGKLDPSGLRACSTFVASAHKFGGPKGVGWLAGFISQSVQLGGEQEQGKRGGTENFPAIEGMRIAWHECTRDTGSVEERSGWRDGMEGKIRDSIPEIKIIGQSVPRLWNTSLLVMPEFDNLSWVGKLDKLGHQVSTGSACSTGSIKPSPTARAHGLSPEQAKRVLRISSFLPHSQSDWEKLGDAILEAHRQLLEESKNSSVISI